MATIIFSGRLTADVNTSNGWSNFTVAEDKKFKTNNQSSVNFFNCKAKLSDAQLNTLRKGSKVEVVGCFDFETYEKDGVKFYKHSVFVCNMSFLPTGKKKAESAE